MDVHDSHVPDVVVQRRMRGRASCWGRGVRRWKHVVVRRVQRGMHGGVRMGLLFWSLPRHLRGRDAQGGGGVRRWQ